MATVEGKNSVPQWFHEFAIANEKAHSDSAQAISGVKGDLGSDIASVKGELRIIKGLMFGVTGAVLIAFLKYMIGF